MYEGCCQLRLTVGARRVWEKLIKIDCNACLGPDQKF